MNALTKSLAAAAILTGAFLSAPAHALPNCATAGGMTITPPAGSSQSPDAGGCLYISGPTNTGYNWAYWGYTPDEQEAFKQLLADTWGGSASDWIYLYDIDGRRDTPVVGSFPENFTSFDVWTGGNAVPTPGSSGASGSFSVSITEDSTFPTPFETRLMDIVGVMKPDSIANPGDKSQRGTFEDSVLAYLFSDVQITQRGILNGTYDLRDPSASPTAAPLYSLAGLGFFGRVATAVNPTPIPEPGVLALIGIAALGAAAARRKRAV